jgi:hypothetical protein
MSDMGSHLNDLPFWALKLRDPLPHRSRRPSAAPRDCPGVHARPLHLRRPRRPTAGDDDLVSGHQETPYYTEGRIPKWDMAILFVGDRGMLLSDYGKHILLPEEKFREFKRPDPFIPPSPGHFEEWLIACKTGRPTGSNFQYAAALTIANHLGNVAYRVGRKLEWDPTALQARGVPAADALIRKSYRQGWKLDALPASR